MSSELVLFRPTWETGLSQTLPKAGLFVFFRHNRHYKVVPVKSKPLLNYH